MVEPQAPDVATGNPASLPAPLLQSSYRDAYSPRPSGGCSPPSSCSSCLCVAPPVQHSYHRRRRRPSPRLPSRSRPRALPPRAPRSLPAAPPPGVAPSTYLLLAPHPAESGAGVPPRLTLSSYLLTTAGGHTRLPVTSTRASLHVIRWIRRDLAFRVLPTWACSRRRAHPTHSNLTSDQMMTK